MSGEPNVRNLRGRCELPPPLTLGHASAEDRLEQRGERLLIAASIAANRDLIVRHGIDSRETHVSLTSGGSPSRLVADVSRLTLQWFTSAAARGKADRKQAPMHRPRS